MTAITLELGPNAVALLTPITAAVATWIASRKMRREFTNNGGSTLRDAIDRIERRLDAAGISADPADRRQEPRA